MPGHTYLSKAALTLNVAGRQNRQLFSWRLSGLLLEENWEIRSLLRQSRQTERVSFPGWILQGENWENLSRNMYLDKRTQATQCTVILSARWPWVSAWLHSKNLPQKPNKGSLALAYFRVICFLNKGYHREVLKVVLTLKTDSFKKREGRSQDNEVSEKRQK